MHDRQEIHRAAIAETHAAFVAALARGDARAAAAAYSVGGRLLPPSAVLLRGRPAIAAFWQAGLDAGLTDVGFTSLELAAHDALAYEIGCYAIQMTPPSGAPIVDRGKYVLVHELGRDGTWLRAVEMFNPEATSVHPDAPHPPSPRHEGDPR
jgi:ketosteroid isomerase-like protein